MLNVLRATICPKTKLNWTPWPEYASELYRPRDRRLPATLVPYFADRGCHVVSVTDPRGRLLGSPDRSRYFILQVAPHLYSRGWVDPVRDPLLLRKSGSAGNRTRTSGSAARNPGNLTTDALIVQILPAALGPGAYSNSNRNEYQKQNNNVYGE
jgi:hypothetical protein